MSGSMKEAITEKALLQRLNRRLRQEREDQFVYRSRRPAERYYLLVRGDRVVQRHVDVESLGRQKGALREHEVVGL